MHEKGRLGAENGEGGGKRCCVMMGGRWGAKWWWWMAVGQRHRERDISVHRCVPKGLLSKASAR